MNKVILNVEGMSCGMCENHVNDAVRSVVNAKKISSDHAAGKTEIIIDGQPDIAAIKHAIKATGYKVTGVTVEPYEKKGFSLFRK